MKIPSVSLVSLLEYRGRGRESLWDDKASSTPHGYRENTRCRSYSNVWK